MYKEKQIGCVRKRSGCMKQRKPMIVKWCVRIGAALLSGLGVFCVAVRLSGVELRPSIQLAAAELAMPTGNAAYSRFEKLEPDIQTQAEQVSVPKTEKRSEQSHPDEKNTAQTSSDKQTAQEKKSGKENDKSGSNTFEAHDATKEEIASYDKEHEGEEQYPVHEFTVTEGNCCFEDVQVKNTASAEIDIQEELKAPLGFTIEKTDEPQVLIYHTHTTESYLPYDTGYFYESFFPRSTEQSENVCAVGEEIAKQLNAAGIKTIHDTTLHDYPSYSGAYDRSLETIEEYLRQYPTIKVVLDIHRDGIGTDTEKYKPVFTAEGRQGAQMMVLAGYNYDDSEEFADWEYNLRFALRIQQAAAKRCPEMMRPVNFSDFMYNMNVNTGSLLIEVGGEANTIEEARFSGYMMGKVLCDVLKDSAG